MALAVAKQAECGPQLAVGGGTEDCARLGKPIRRVHREFQARQNGRVGPRCAWIMCSSSVAAPKTELENVGNLEKDSENSKHSQTFDNLSQGWEFLKVSLLNTRTISQVCGHACILKSLLLHRHLITGNYIKSTMNIYNFVKVAAFLKVL